MNFMISALKYEQFAPLFGLSDDKLVEFRAIRRTATSEPGFPCRVSLADAEIGDQLILVNYAHQDAYSPYHSSHAIFAREGAKQARPTTNEVPD